MERDSAVSSMSRLYVGGAQFNSRRGWYFVYFKASISMFGPTQPT